MDFIDADRSNVLLFNLNESRLKEELCDIRLQASDNANESIPCHKNVLAASTPYFSIMFNGVFDDSQKSTITLNEITFDSLKAVIEYLYTGCLRITQDNVQNLLYTSSLLQISWIEDQCCDFLAQSLDVVNCLGIKIYADRYCCKDLSNKAIEFTAKNFKEVQNSDEFFALNFEELCGILSNDVIYINSEDMIYKAIIRWIEHMSETRKIYLSELLKFIHPALVSETLVSGSSIVLENDSCKDWAAKALGTVGELQINVFVLDKIGKSSDLTRYEFNTQNLVQLEPIPEQAFAVSFVGDKNFLYVFGGQLSPQQRRDNAFYYNIYRNKWLQLTPLIHPRSHHRSCILDNNIYTIGGNGLGGPMCNVECLDLNTGRAYEIQEMLDERRSMAAAANENCLYVMGGEDDHQCYHSMERYDPRIGKWYELASMNQVNSYCSCAIVNDNIYCCEGLGNCIERYDFRMNIWDVIDLPEEREFYELFPVENQLFSISGAEISKYRFSANEWETVYKFQVCREWDTALSLKMHVY